MTLKERFTQYEGDFLDFDSVPIKLNRRADLHAFLLLDILLPNTRDIVGSAEHDEIWLNIDTEVLANVISDEQIQELIRCGVMYDETFQALHMFV